MAERFEDHTNLTDWERFISTIVATLRTWGFEDGDEGDNTALQASISSEKDSEQHESSEEALLCSAGEATLNRKGELRSRMLSFGGVVFYLRFYSLEHGLDVRESVIGKYKANSMIATVPPLVHALDDEDADFLSKTRRLQRWCGLKTFLVLSGEYNGTKNAFGDSLSAMMKSTMSIALATARVALPCFVEVKDGTNPHRFTGIYAGETFEYSLDTANFLVKEFKPLDTAPTVDAISRLFKARLEAFCSHSLASCLHDSPLPVRLPPTRYHVRLIYEEKCDDVKRKVAQWWLEAERESSALSEKGLIRTTSRPNWCLEEQYLRALRSQGEAKIVNTPPKKVLGIREWWTGDEMDGVPDPVESVQVALEWAFREGELVENEVANDLRPSTAQSWHFRFNSRKEWGGPLADRLRHLLRTLESAIHICDAKERPTSSWREREELSDALFAEILPDMRESGEEEERREKASVSLSEALRESKGIEHAPVLGKKAKVSRAFKRGRRFFLRALRKMRSSTQVRLSHRAETGDDEFHESNEDLDEAYAKFEEALSELFGDVWDSSHLEEQLGESSSSRLKDLHLSYQSAPRSSLAERLARSALQQATIQEMCMLWKETLSELEFRLEYRIPLPFSSPIEEVADGRTMDIHQCFVLLNTCIRRLTDVEASNDSTAMEDRSERNVEEGDVWESFDSEDENERKGDSASTSSSARDKVTLVEVSLKEWLKKDILGYVSPRCKERTHGSDAESERDVQGQTIGDESIDKLEPEVERTRSGKFGLSLNEEEAVGAGWDVDEEWGITDEEVEEDEEGFASASEGRSTDVDNTPKEESLTAGREEREASKEVEEEEAEGQIRETEVEKVQSAEEERVDTVGMGSEDIEEEEKGKTAQEVFERPEDTLEASVANDDYWGKQLMRSSEDVKRIREGKRLGAEKPLGLWYTGTVSTNDFSDIQDKESLKLYMPTTQGMLAVPHWLVEDKDGDMLTEFVGEGAEYLLLKSDMMAFKAANPHAIFEDFVRWHSPRDWICRSDVIADLQAENAAKEEEGESEVEKRAETVQQIERMAMELGIGRLSERMSSGGGVWRRLWEEAEAVPVVRQRPLVNFHRLAKAVISFLQSLSPAEVIGRLFHISLISAIDRLSALKGTALTGSNSPLAIARTEFMEAFDSLYGSQESRIGFLEGSFGERVNATSEAIERERQAIEIVTQALSVFEELERHVAIALSLFAKLSGEGTTEEQVIAFVDKVLRDGSVAMEEGAVRDAAGRLAGCFKIDRTADAREVVLRLNYQELPSRMYFLYWKGSAVLGLSLGRRP